MVSRAGRRFNLGFASSTENRGVGPLMITGARQPGRPMRAHQTVEMRGGASASSTTSGACATSPTHRTSTGTSSRSSLPAASSERLRGRRARRQERVLPHRPLGARVAGIPGTGPPRFVGDCGTRQPTRTARRTGHSVGYIDRYPAFFHGQELNVTRLPAGRTSRPSREPGAADPRARLLDDSASVLLELTWPNGPRSAPRISILRRCEAASAAPPADGSPYNRGVERSDVLVVGAGPAGSARRDPPRTARGARIVLADRASFPATSPAAAG